MPYESPPAGRLLGSIGLPTANGDRGGMGTTQTIRVQRPFHSRRPVWIIRGVGALVASIVVAAFFFAPAFAFAGHSATGQLAFYPCTQCHPVTLDAEGKPTKPLPIGMAKHEVTLEVHDILGGGTAACVVCHDDPTANPGMLRLSDGSLVEITGDVSRVCQRCHFEKYREWTLGIHGKHEAKCSAAGCHDPHTPSWIYMKALPPFQGTGVEIKAVANREPFQPLAPPPLKPAVYTPIWLAVVAGVGMCVVLAILGYLVLGKVKR